MATRVLGATCPACMFATKLWPWGQASQLRAITTKSKPSRMILSAPKHVARPSNSETRPRRRPVEGPFAAMNTTHFRRPDSAARSTGLRARSESRPGMRPSRTGDKPSSREDFKTMKMHRALADVSYRKRTQIKDDILEYESFDQFNLLPSVHQGLTADVLAGMVDIKPTPVQRLAIPALMGRKTRLTARSQKGDNDRAEFLLAAETGSGKTLAYLLPAINALKVAEAEDADFQSYKRRMEEEKAREKAGKTKSKFHDPHPSIARPKIVVLVPSAELVDQVGKVAKKLSHAVKFRTEKISAKMKAEIIERHIYSPYGVDMIIATPQLLASIADSDPNILSRVTDLIIDEADSLFDRSFAPITSTIVQKALPSVKRFVCCSATIPRGLDKYLANQFPDMVRLTTPNLHAVPRRVQLGIIDVSKDPYRDNKDLAAADAIYSIGRESARHEGPIKEEIDIRRVLVFVNERETVQPVAEYLQSKGIDAIALHRDTDEHRQSAMLASFTSAEPLRAQASIPDPAVKAKRSLPNVKVIVATDLASRGIDTLAVRHVILYDVPHTTIDFIHRLGRAGRMGRRGRGIVLAGRKDRRDVIAEVKRAMFMGQALI